jgi:hypothetical protein
MIEFHERLAALEADRQTDREMIEKVLEEVSSINAHLNKYKGFIGAVWFAISCVGVFFSAIKFFHKG